jgi:hypothetical protein
MAKLPLPIPDGIDDRDLYKIPPILTDIPPGDYPEPLFLTAKPAPFSALPELEKPASTEKHGRHDQASHGNWAHGSNAEERKLARLFHRAPTHFWLSEGKTPHSELEAAGMNYTYWSGKRILGADHPGDMISPNRKTIYAKEPLSVETLLKNDLHPIGEAAGHAMIEYYRKRFGGEGDDPFVLTNGRSGREFRGAVVHPSAKYRDAPAQATYFDRDGFSGDTGFKTWVEAAADLITSGHRYTMSPDDFDKYTDTKRFTEGVIRNLEMQRLWAQQQQQWREEHKEGHSDRYLTIMRKMAMPRLKHLPGQHDQADHGNRAGAGGEQPPIEKWIARRGELKSRLAKAIDEYKLLGQVGVGLEASSSITGHGDRSMHPSYYTERARAAFKRKTGIDPDSRMDELYSQIRQLEAALNQVDTAIGNISQPGALKHLQGQHDQASHGSWAHGQAGELPAGDPRREANFKRWFGKSKVVDDQGKPLVAYHGTPTHPEYSNNPYVRSEQAGEWEAPEFTEFETSGWGITDSGWLGQGAYFTPDPDYAHEFGNKIIPAYLKVEKPFVIYDDNSTGYTNSYNFRKSLEGLEGIPEELKLDETLKPVEIYHSYHEGDSEFYLFTDQFQDTKGATKWHVVKTWEKESIGKGGIVEASGFTKGEAIAKYNDKRAGKDNWGFLLHLVKKIGASRFTAILKKAGYDGVLEYSGYRDDETGEVTVPWRLSEILIYDPRQVKSALANIGTFDPENPSMLKSLKGSLVSALKHLSGRHDQLAHGNWAPDKGGGGPPRQLDLFNDAPKNPSEPTLLPPLPTWMPAEHKIVVDPTKPPDPNADHSNKPIVGGFGYYLGYIDGKYGRYQFVQGSMPLTKGKYAIFEEDQSKYRFGPKIKSGLGWFADPPRSMAALADADFEKTLESVKIQAEHNATLDLFRNRKIAYKPQDPLTTGMRDFITHGWPLAVSSRAQAFLKQLGMRPVDTKRLLSKLDYSLSSGGKRMYDPRQILNKYYEWLDETSEEKKELNPARIRNPRFRQARREKHLSGQHDQSSHGNWAKWRKAAGPVFKGRTTESFESMNWYLSEHVDPDRPGPHFFVRNALVSGNPGAATQEIWEQEKKTGDEFMDVFEESEAPAQKAKIAEKIAAETGLTPDQVSNVVKSWSSSSNDEKYTSLLAQSVGAELMGQELSDWQKHKLDGVAETRKEFIDWNKSHPEEIARYETLKGDLERLTIEMGVLYDRNEKLSHKNRDVNIDDWPAEDREELFSVGDRLAKASTQLDNVGREMDDIARKPNSMDMPPNLVSPFTDAYGRLSPDLKYKSEKAAMRAVLKAMYKQTQEQFRQAGIKELVVYRGVGFDDRLPVTVGGIADLTQNFLESWSLRSHIAGQFGQGMVNYSYVLGMKIPIERVFCTARSGFGCLEEFEVIVYNGKAPDEVAIVQDIVQSFGYFE